MAQPKVFRMSADCENYAWFTLVDEEVADQIEPVYDAIPVAENWHAPLIETTDDLPTDNSSTFSDFPVFWTVPTYSAKAVVALRDFLDASGELLPLRGAPYFVHNVLNVVDALDESNSRLERFDDGGIMHVEHFVLNKEALGDSAIFKLKNYHRVEVFAKEPVRERVINHNLTGFEFEAVEIR